MRSFWRRHCAIRVLSYLILAFLLFVCGLPYRVSLDDTQAEIPLDELVREHGRFLDIDGVSIYVEEQNPQSAQETIVFIHGLGGPTFSWRYNVPFFASQGYRVVSPDLKRSGLSYKDFSSDYSYSSQADLLAEVLDALGIDQAHLVGHSMGVSVMLHFAPFYLEKVLGLTSVDSASGRPARSYLCLVGFRAISENWRGLLNSVRNKGARSLDSEECLLPAGHCDSRGCEWLLRPTG